MSEFERRAPTRWAGGGYIKLIEPVQFLYSLYLSGSMSLVSQSVRFLVQFQRDPTHSDDATTATCRSLNATGSDPKSDVESEAARWLMYMDLAGLLPALFSTILLGDLSNRVGRKLVLLLPLIGGTLRMFIFLLVFTLNLHVGYLVLSSFVDGFFGMSCAMLMACFSYTSDITTHHQRSIRIVILQLSSGLALIVSSLATGFVIKSIGYVWMFVILIGVLAVAFCYIVFVLQESLVFPPLPESGRSVASLKPFFGTFRLFLMGSGSGRRNCLLVALFVSVLVGFVQLGRINVQILFLFTYPFCFNSVWIGYFSATFYLVVNIAMILATWTLGRFIGDIGLVFLGSAFGVIYELVFGFAVNTLMVFLAPLAGCGMVIPISLLRAYISKIVDPSDVASAFACFAWLETISGFVGGITQNAIFASTVSWKPNLVFLFDAGLYGVAFVVTFIFLTYLRHLRRRAQEQPIVNYDADNDDDVPDHDDVIYFPELR